MTKIKRAFIILAFLFVFALVILIPSVSTGTAYAAESAEGGSETITGTIEEEEVGQEKDWGDWIKNELVPYVILAITAISTIIIAVSPILAKVKTASERFKNATSDVNRTASEGDANAKKIEAFTERSAQQLQEISDNFIAKVNDLDERISRIEKTSANTERIARIAFGNTRELVEKGYAAEIEKVGVGDEQRKEETKP